MTLRIATWNVERATTDLVPDGWLSHPPIDHVCVSRGIAGGASVVEVWDGKAPDGMHLSDHSALVVELARTADVRR